MSTIILIISLIPKFKFKIGALQLVKLLFFKINTRNRLFDTNFTKQINTKKIFTFRHKVSIWILKGRNST